MRVQFCDSLISHSRNPNVVFLTGDLGFMALEPLRDAMQNRFINAGIAEQNMISVAAGLAKQDLDVWVYSIAPFCYARGFEQIRNDVTFHNLPVKIVGNGGGYGYGVMGPTHHAIEDYGILLTLPNLKVFIPAFDQDIETIVSRIVAHSGASYLRLGRGEPPKDWRIMSYAPWRQLTEGDGPVVIAVGPLAGTYIEVCNAIDMKHRPNLWVISELPLSLNPIPERLLSQLTASGTIIVAEEHVRQGSFGADLVLDLMRRNIGTIRMYHMHALAHHYQHYGSQSYLRKQSKLDPNALMETITVSHRKSYPAI